MRRRYLSKGYGYTKVNTDEDFDLAVNKHFGKLILGVAEPSAALGHTNCALLLKCRLLQRRTRWQLRRNRGT